MIERAFPDEPIETTTSLDFALKHKYHFYVRYNFSDRSGDFYTYWDYQRDWSRKGDD